MWFKLLKANLYEINLPSSEFNAFCISVFAQETEEDKNSSQ
jgi:hypothetical protein